MSTVPIVQTLDFATQDETMVIILPSSQIHQPPHGVQYQFTSFPGRIRLWLLALAHVVLMKFLEGDPVKETLLPLLSKVRTALEMRLGSAIRESAHILRFPDPPFFPVCISDLLDTSFPLFFSLVAVLRPNFVGLLWDF